MLSKNKIKYIQSLCHKKKRAEENLFIAEGTKIVEELLHTNLAQVHSIYATQDWAEANKNLTKNLIVEIIEPFELEKTSTLTTPNKVLAIVHQPKYDYIPNAIDQLVLVLDGIQDPGNLGTIIRIADWFGITQIVCSDNTVDCYNPKVIQATMGSFLRVQVHYTAIENYLQQYKNIPILAAVMQGEPLKKIEPMQHGILIIGNEGSGISENIMQHATQLVTIHKKGIAESLNASVATGILLAHLTY